MSNFFLAAKVRIIYGLYKATIYFRSVYSKNQ